MQDVNYEKLEEWAEMLKAMAHPVRLCILKRLYRDGDKNVTAIQECLKIPQSTVSQHLSTLRNKGIIRGRRSGLEVTYSIANEEVRHIIYILLNSARD